MTSSRAPRRAFLVVNGVIFTASAAMTAHWCASMSAMGTMAMPGDWAMSMTWARLPGRTWLDSALTFVVTWIVMMIAMMLPSLTPALMRVREPVAGATVRRRCLVTTATGVGYFMIWAAAGAVAFPAGALLSTLVMRLPVLSRAIPVASGVVVLLAGAVQLSAWKARRLACCHDTSTHGLMPGGGIRDAVRHGARLGIQCVACCANLMAILLVAGIMDLGVMLAVTAAITAERGVRS